MLNSFEELIGQAAARRVLENAIRRERIAHAYLFRGPESVGKATLAGLFARSLDCRQSAGPGEACGRCHSCQLAAAGNHPDLRLITFEVNPKSRLLNTEIVMAQIREDAAERYRMPPLLEDAYLRPVYGPWKVYLIDPADRLNSHAADALLKVLEEPPPQVVLVLMTARPAALHPTVVSRCQQVAFRPVSSLEIAALLGRLGVGAEEASWLAAVSAGRPGWAVRLARDEEGQAVRRSLLDLLASIPQRPKEAALRIADDLRAIALGSRLADEAPRWRATEGEEESARPRNTGERELRIQLALLLELMLGWYRDLAVAGARPELVANQDRKGEIEALAGRLGPGGARAGLEAALGARRQIQRNANLGLALESLALDLLAAG
jgi:DNA polymerase-3 subunit delta'